MEVQGYDQSTLYTFADRLSPYSGRVAWGGLLEHLLCGQVKPVGRFHAACSQKLYTFRQPFLPGCFGRSFNGRNSDSEQGFSLLMLGLGKDLNTPNSSDRHSRDVKRHPLFVLWPQDDAAAVVAELARPIPGGGRWLLSLRIR